MGDHFYKSEHLKTPLQWNSPSVQPDPTQQPPFRILDPTLMATRTPSNVVHTHEDGGEMRTRN
jgi:hypothetical protein